MCQHIKNKKDSCQRIVWDVATCGGTLVYKHDEPTSFFFFFALSPFLFFSSRVLHCRKPVRLFACQQGNYHHYNFHLCLRRIVLNKTHNREIPLRNSRMRINLDASMKKSQVESFLSVCQSISGAATITNRESILCILIAWMIPVKESFRMPQPAVALSNTNMMSPQLFFFVLLSISFLLVARGLPCGVAYRPLHVLAREFFIIFVSVDLCWTKRMTGKSRCEMRGWV